jgi:Methyltransferase domain
MRTLIGTLGKWRTGKRQRPAEREWAMGSEDEVLNEQRAYYRGRAPEYDEWWQRRGSYDRGEEEIREWHRQVASVDAALRSFDVKGDVLELAGGTGWWTERLAATADRLTVVDAAPEVLALNRQRVGREDVSYVIADLFDWRPERSYDVVFFSFWLSICQVAVSVPSGALCGPHCDQPVECSSSTTAETTQPSTLRLRGIPTWSSTGLTFIGAALAMAPNISWSR